MEFDCHLNLDSSEMQLCPLSKWTVPIHKLPEGVFHLPFQVVDKVVVSRIVTRKLLLQLSPSRVQTINLQLLSDPHSYFSHWVSLHLDWNVPAWIQWPCGHLLLPLKQTSLKTWFTLGKFILAISSHTLLLHLLKNYFTTAQQRW